MIHYCIPCRLSPEKIPAQDVACGFFRYFPNTDSLSDMKLVWDDPMLVGPNLAQKALYVYCKVNESKVDDPAFLSTHTALKMEFDSCFPALAEVQTPAGEPHHHCEIRLRAAAGRR